MNKSSLPVGVKTLMKYQDGGTLLTDSPVQRKAGQWNNLQQSMLIHSMLADYIIPNLYFQKEVTEGKNMLSVLDGLQRLTTVFSFIRDEWMTHPKTPKVTFDGSEYDISLKKFSELDDELKSAILGYRFTTYQLEDCTDDEIEETFTRLNSGTALSKIQQARPKLGIELAEWCNHLVEKKFFQNALNLTASMLRREDDFLCLLTTMMLLEDKYYGDFKIKTSASAAECVRFAEEIKDDYSDDKKEEIEKLVDYLDEAFPAQEYKFLRKNNIPIVMYIAFICLSKGVSAEEYRTSVVDFYENDCNEKYNEASGAGNVKLVNVSTRLFELMGAVQKRYPDYFEDENSAENSSEDSELSDVSEEDESMEEEKSSEELPQDGVSETDNEADSEDFTEEDSDREAVFTDVDADLPFPEEDENAEDNGGALIIGENSEDDSENSEDSYESDSEDNEFDVEDGEFLEDEEVSSGEEN